MPTTVDLLRHVLDVCEDPDCEIHRIDVGLDEQTVTSNDLAFYVAGAIAMELAIRRNYRGNSDRSRIVEACRRAGRHVFRRAYVIAYGCDDCGAPAGRECYPEYGCRPTSRTVA